MWNRHLAQEGKVESECGPKANISSEYDIDALTF